MHVGPKAFATLAGSVNLSLHPCRNHTLLYSREQLGQDVSSIMGWSCFISCWKTKLWKLVFFSSYNYEFTSRNWIFFFRIERYKVAIVSYKVRIARYKLAMWEKKSVFFFLRIGFFNSQLWLYITQFWLVNSQFWLAFLTTHNSDFLTRNSDSQFWQLAMLTCNLTILRKKSELLYVNSQLREKCQHCEMKKFTITFFIFILWRKQASIQNTPLLSHLLEIWKYLEIPNSLDFASHRIQCYWDRCPFHSPVNLWEQTQHKLAEELHCTA